MSTEKSQIIVDLFWTENLYEVPSDKLEQSPHLEPKYNPWGIIPYAKSGPKESRLTVYDTKDADDARPYYRDRYFRKQDIRIMKTCAINWMIAIVKQSKKNTQEPWWSYAYWFNKKSKSTTARLLAINTETISDTELDTFFDLYLKLCSYQYICGRYRYKQDLLWEDLSRDYESMRETFFVDCPTEYFMLLTRVVASYLGEKLGNIAGD